MKKLLLVGVLFAPTPVLAKSPEDVGRIFADVVACHVSGKFNKIEKAVIDLKVIDRYDVAEQSKKWRKRMERGRKKEFRRLDDIGLIEKGIMCGVLEKKWLD